MTTPVARILFSLLLLSGVLRPQADAAEPPMRLLFLGNSLLGISSSYSNNIPGLLTNLSGNLGVPVTYSRVANSSWELRDHATNAPSTNAINTGNYDFVVLQEQTDNPSQPSVRTSKFFPACRTLNMLITNHGEKTMFYDTWGYLNGDTSAHCNGYDIPAQYKTCDGGFGSFSAMNIATRQGYAMIANELGATISPVGLAWARVRVERPDLGIYITDDSLADRHPNSYGAYLAACVFYSTVFGRSPEGSTFYSTNNSSDAQYLQRIAAETVLDDPFAIDAYGFGPNRFRWAFTWANYTNPASAPANTLVISGASATPSPSVRLDTNIGSLGNLRLGTLDTNYSKLGEGRLYITAGGSLTVTGTMTVGREGKGFVRQNGGALMVNGALTLGEVASGAGQYNLSNGTLRAAQILNGAGNGGFLFRGGSLSFAQYGSAARPLNLDAEAGLLSLTNTSGTTLLYGNFTNRNPAMLALELGNSASAFVISGAAALAGTLRLTRAPGFTPGSGQQFILLSAAALTGNFTNVVVPPIGSDGMGFIVSINATSVLATATNFAAHLDRLLMSPNGTLQFTVSGVSGNKYEVQASTNLVNWTSLLTNIAPFDFTSTNTAAASQFFRAVLRP